jgi:hypothetical protein
MSESDAEEYGEQEIDESDASSELSSHVRPILSKMDEQ